MSTGWTIETLKEYYDDKFATQEKEANRLADALKEYKAQANEYRGALKDQSMEFLRRTEAEKDFQWLRDQIVLLQKQSNIGEGMSLSVAATRANTKWLIFLIVTVVLGVIGLLLQAKH